MSVNTSLAKIRWVGFSCGRVLPITHVGAHFRPERLGEPGLRRGHRLSGSLAQKELGRVVNRVERKELALAIGNRIRSHFGHVREHGHGPREFTGELGNGVSMVVENVERSCGPNRVTIQVCKHLLASLQSRIRVHHNRNVLVS